MSYHRQPHQQHWPSRTKKCGKRGIGHCASLHWRLKSDATRLEFGDSSNIESFAIKKTSTWIQSSQRHNQKIIDTDRRGPTPELYEVIKVSPSVEHLYPSNLSLAILYPFHPPLPYCTLYPRRVYQRKSMAKEGEKGKSMARERLEG